MSLTSHVKGLGIENDTCIRIERIFEEKKKNYTCVNLCHVVLLLY